MLSGTIVLQGESSDRFDKLVATLYEEFQPQTPFEESLIDNMAVARWRQMRIWGMEKAGMDYEVRRQAEMSDSITAEDNATRASLAFRTLSDDSRSLELIERYDSSYERQYYRAHRRFLEVRDRRNSPPSGQPTSGPSNLTNLTNLPNLTNDTSPHPGEGSFPTGGRPRIHEMPAPVTPPTPPESPDAEEIVVSKGTREVIANKATSGRRRLRYRRAKPASISSHPLSSAARTGSSGLRREIIGFRR